MTILLVTGLRPQVGAVDSGGGWLYEVLTKFGLAHQTARTVVDLIVRPLSIVLVIAVALAVARLGDKAIRRILDRVAHQATSRGTSASRAGARVNTMSGLIANCWRFFVFVVTVAVILGQLGIDLAPLLASATIIGATLGFGAQLIVRDYFSGFLLTMEDQFNVGEAVTIDGVTGVVEDVTMRITRVRAIDGTVYFIPNGDIRVLGNTSRGWAQAVVDLSLPGATATDLPGVRGIVEGAIHRVAQQEPFAKHCTEPPVLVGFMNADAVNYTLRVTLHTLPSQRDALQRAMREAAIADLAQAGKWPGELPTNPFPN
jgi:small-conductance mechanosensitive channel